MKSNEQVENNFLGDFYIHQFRKRNEKHQNYLLFVIGTRGFFAEITMVVRCAIYALKHDLQLVLKHDEFGFLYNHGWNDYFLPFCKEFTKSMKPEVKLVVSPLIAGNKSNMRKMRAHMPDEINFAGIKIIGFQNIMHFFIKVICRPSLHIQTLVGELTQKLEMIHPYTSIHIRRGDKVGWEDKFYSANLYLDQLKRHNFEDYPMFVMTDDHKALLEFKEILNERKLNNIVYSLTHSGNRGFDVWELRKKNVSYAHGEESISLDPEEFKLHVFKQATQLLTETFIAAQSDVFVGTKKSNVSYMINALHRFPENCFSLSPNHTKKVQNENASSTIDKFIRLNDWKNTGTFSNLNSWVYFASLIPPNYKLILSENSILNHKRKQPANDQILEFKHHLVKHKTELKSKFGFDYTSNEHQNHRNYFHNQKVSDRRRELNRSFHRHFYFDLESFNNKFFELKTKIQARSTIGVHVRFTNHFRNKNIEFNEYLESYFDVVDSLLECNYEQVFLATHLEQVFEAFMARYGDRMLYYDQYRNPNPNSDWKKNKPFDLERKEAVIDMLLLSSTNYIVGGPSNLFYAAMWYNTSIDYSIVPILKGANSL